MTKKKTTAAKKTPDSAAIPAEYVEDLGNGVLRVKVAAFQTDQKNANMGTERGNSALEYSITNYGAGRSIVVDKNLNIIAGNKTMEQWVAGGHDTILLVPNDQGRELVAVLRDDLDLYDEEDPRGRLYAYADNRVGQLNLQIDAARIRADTDAGLELPAPLFSQNEIEAIRRQGEVAPPGEFPEFDEDIDVDYKCPQCSYGWSGKPK